MVELWQNFDCGAALGGVHEEDGKGAHFSHFFTAPLQIFGFLAQYFQLPGLYFFNVFIRLQKTKLSYFHTPYGPHPTRPFQRHRENMDWTIGLLDRWTIGPIFGLFFGPIIGPFFFYQY